MTEVSRDARDLPTARQAIVSGEVREGELFGLLELRGNGRLVETVANLRDQTRDCPWHAANHTRTEAAAERRGTLEAVLAGRRDDVGDQLTLHLGHIREQWAHPAPAGR